MSNLMDTFIAKYGQSDNVRMVKSLLRICPIGAHSDYQGGLVTGMTLDASVDMIYTPREDDYVEIQSEDFLDTELFSFGHDLEYIPGSSTSEVSIRYTNFLYHSKRRYNTLRCLSKRRLQYGC